MSSFETNLGNSYGRGQGPSAGGAESDNGTSSGGTGATSSGAPSNTQTQPREIEESDIYKLVGNNLFVLNRYRGLQVLDISNLDAPRLIGKAPIYGYPKEMYVRDNKAYIIVSDYYSFWRNEVDDSSDGFYGSLLRVVDIADPANPQVLGSIQLQGDCGDSRIVGDVMYLVSERYSWYWHYGSSDNEDKTTILSVNIADPANIHVVDTEDFPRNGWEQHISVTPETIYIASSGWEQMEDPNGWNGHYVTKIRAADIRNAGGAITLRGEITVRGRVMERWAMDEFQDVLRVASGDSWGNGDVYLTTIDVANKDQLTQLAQYTLHVSEQLTAARFYGTHGYLVSYRSVDPLFTFDLSDAAHPQLMGELEMTGWLDFMVPMGDRIVALGHEDVTDAQGNRSISLAVSLIDPTPATPVLLSRVVLDGVWGWIPAERDDFAKVFRVLGEQGLVLFPFQAWDRDNYRYIGGVQLVDFNRQALTLRGLIGNAGWVERGIPHGQDTVLTLSSEVFQIVDIANRDQPRLRSRLELARNVQEFAILDDQSTVQLSGDWYMGDTQLTITPIDDPDSASPATAFHVPAPYGRMFMNGSMAYVASVQEGGTDANGNAQNVTKIQVVDLSDKAHPVLRGTVTLPQQVWLGYHSWYWGSGDEVVQVNGSVLAFHPYTYWYWYGDCYDCGYGGNNEPPPHQVYIVDLGNADHPTVASTVTLEGVSWAWGLKAQGSMLYLSDYRSFQRDNTWYARYYLRRIDVSNPAHPVELPEVNIPGMFLGASADNRYIYTEENSWDSGTSTSTTRVHALALVGHSAYLRSSVDLPGYLNNVIIQGATAYTSTNWYDTTTDANGYQTWHNHMQLVTLDLSDVHNIHVAGQVDLPYEWAWLQHVENGLAFMGSYAGMFIYSVDNAQAPTFRQFFRTQGWVQDVVLHNGRAFLPSGYTGVQVLDLATLQPL